MIIQSTLVTSHKGVDLHAETAGRVMKRDLEGGDRLVRLSRAEFHTFWHESGNAAPESIARLLGVGRFFNPNKHHYAHFELSDAGADWFTAPGRGAAPTAGWPGTVVATDLPGDVEGLVDRLLRRRHDRSAGAGRPSRRGAQRIAGIARESPHAGVAGDGRPRGSLTMVLEARHWRDECGVVGLAGVKGAGELAALALHALQHRGQESAGVSVSDGHAVRTHREMGLVADIFTEPVVKTLGGTFSLGHVRYSTTGSSLVENAQPMQVTCHRGAVSVAHNGNLVNAHLLRREMELDGSIFATTSDTEVFLHLIARSRAETFAEAVAEAANRVSGAFSLLVLTRDKLIAVRDPRGFRPLCVGRFQDSYVVASESCAFDIIGGTYLRDVEPGEMIVLDGNGLISRRYADPQPTTQCVFEHIYFSRPDSTVFGQSVDEIRRGGGEVLGDESPVDADIVCSVPDSSNTAALGFADRVGLPYELGLIRNHYVGRTVISPAQKVRDMSVRIKFNPVRRIMTGKRVVLIDDSIVRGTTMRKLVKLVRAAGATEVHLRIASPPVTHPCYYGIDTPVRNELIASSHKVDEIATYLRVDSLAYLSLEGLLRATGEPGRYCSACFTGRYPVPFESELSKEIMDRDVGIPEVGSPGGR